MLKHFDWSICVKRARAKTEHSFIFTLKSLTSVPRFSFSTLCGISNVIELSEAFLILINFSFTVKSI